MWLCDFRHERRETQIHKRTFEISLESVCVCGDANDFYFVILATFAATQNICSNYADL